MTPNSNATSYLDASDFLLRRDVTSVYAYSTDGASGPPQGPTPTQMTAILLDDTTPQGKVLASRMAAASGMLESALLRSSRYAATDIVALLSMGGNSAEYLKEILADICMFKLCTRRPGPAPPETVVSAYNEALAALNDLSTGSRIFAFVEAEAAGLPQVNQFNISDYYRNNLFTTRSRSMFGDRGMNKRYNGIW
jgi:hypothetical protein